MGEGIHTLRFKAMERDGRKCTRCGDTQYICVHHIKPISEGGENTLDNLTVLCKCCHTQDHRNRGGPGLRKLNVAVSAECWEIFRDYQKDHGYRNRDDAMAHLLMDLEKSLGKKEAKA